jgi:hypothetical protein
MATTIDTNIVLKYINNAKVASDVFNGEKYSNEIDKKLFEELANSDLSMEEILANKIAEYEAGIKTFLDSLPDVEKSKYQGIETYTKLPKIISHSNISLNRFIELNNGSNVLVSVPKGINKGLFAYKLDEENGKLLKLLELPEINEEEDVRKIASFELCDIFWNTKEKKYQFVWVSVGDNKVRTALINEETKTLEEIEIITNNTSVKGGVLRANMNEDGDIVVFTSSKASDNYFYGIVITKERSLNSWQTTDLLKHADKQNDYGAFGRVQIVGSDFFYIYSDGATRLYFVKKQELLQIQIVQLFKWC